MKNLIPILLSVFALVSCEKEPDTDKFDNEYLVFTNHDTNAKFNDFNTYYLPDSILVIGEKKEPEYWKDENAGKLVSAFEARMNAAGYTRTIDKDAADLGMQVSYVESTYYFRDYYYDESPWWNYYPGYWYPGYWGGNWGGGWYYPYAITYRYSTGSLLSELVNLKAPEGQGAKLPVLWSAYISGPVGGSGSLNVDRAMTAINQAFAQSTYLKK